MCFVGKQRHALYMVFKHYFLVGHRSNFRF